MTSRSFPTRHKVQQEEEDAAALKLGPGTSEDAVHAVWFTAANLSHTEFNNAGCLLISEVKYLLENRDKDAPDTVCVSQVPPVSHRPAQSISPIFYAFRVYNKTLEYVKTFAKFNTTDSASAVRE
jgi:DNA-directed RNA polymerase II subunit RPB4